MLYDATVYNLPQPKDENYLELGLAPMAAPHRACAGMVALRDSLGSAARIRAERSEGNSRELEQLRRFS